MKRFIAVVIALVCCLACSKSAPTAEVSTLTVALTDAPKTLDPRYATGTTGMRLTHQVMYDTLVRMGTDLQVGPALAKSWKVLTPTHYRFHLRKDVQFHNGLPLQAADVVATIQSMKDPAIKSPFAAIYKIIRELRAVDDYTVDMFLTEPKAAFLLDLSMAIFPRTGKAEVGTGPFILESQSPQEVVLRRNEKYWDGAPKVERLVFKIVKDDNTRVLKMLHGDIDMVINSLPRNQIAKFSDNKDFQVVEGPGLAYQYLVVNMRNPILQQKKVRQAIAHAINVPEIIEYRLKGHAKPAKSLLSPMSWFHNDDVASYSFDPKRAQALLNAAGYPDPDGDGPKMRMSIELKTSNNPEVVGIARVLQAQLKAVGIALDLRSFEWGTFYGDVSSGNFTLASMRWVGVTEPDFYYPLFHSTQAPPAGRNRGFYQNAKLDKLVEAGRVESDPKKRQALYNQVQAIVADELPYISLWHNNNVTVLAKRVQGYEPHPNGGFYSLKRVTLQPK